MRSSKGETHPNGEVAMEVTLDIHGVYHGKLYRWSYGEWDPMADYELGTTSDDARQQGEAAIRRWLEAKAYGTTIITQSDATGEKS